MPARLVDRHPELSPGRILAELVPPPHFADVRFDTYLPDPEQPSQRAAVTALQAFARDVDTAPARRRGLLARRRTAAPERTGAYLDGGFGVGKAHLLASLWYEASHPKAYGTFVELTNLVGALGFEAAATALGQHRLLCVDEFELDDPGDTVLMSSLLRRLVESGVRLAATSNTLPGKLGEGRFAADDFLREIQGLSAYFDILRIDGEDYRHRGLAPAPEPYDDATLVEMAHRAGDGATLDDFDALVEHLGRVHPSRYGALLDGVTAVHLRAVETVEDQSVALRLVVLADRLYDRDVPVLASGVGFDEVFSSDMRTGGYRKKYFRAVSRLGALARAAGHAS